MEGSVSDLLAQEKSFVLLLLKKEWARHCFENQIWI